MSDRKHWPKTNAGRDELDRVLAVAGAIACAMVLGLILCLVGCAVPLSAADRIRDRTGMADGLIRVWHDLTADEQFIAAQKMRRGFHAIRWELLDEPPADEGLRARMEVLAEIDRRDGGDK